MRTPTSCSGPRRRHQLPSLRSPKLSEIEVAKHIDVWLVRHYHSFISDRRGAVAFETLIVYAFMLIFLLLPLADVAAASFQFISAWGALRAFGEYVQYNYPSDVTNTSAWKSGLPKAVSGYLMNNVQVLCGNTSAGMPCTSTNVTTSPVKYYSFSTTVTVAPLILGSVFCGGSTQTCTFTLPYSERFQ